MITVALIFIITALLGCSLSIWSEKFSRGLKAWMVITFAIAFTCDLIGTSMMFYLATTKFNWSVHSLCGYAALVFMGLPLAWAIIAIRYHGLAEKYFHRCSIFAWLVWLAAFISGVPRV